VEGRRFGKESTCTRPLRDLWPLAAASPCSPDLSCSTLKMSPAAFSSEELISALNEVALWGLTAFTVLPSQFSPPNESRAKVELLEEGESAVVRVSEKGWKVCLRSVVDFNVSNARAGAVAGGRADGLPRQLQRLPEDSAAKDEQSFETLDHLLAYLSPEFERRRMDVLTRKLESIAVRRNWGEEDDGAAEEGDGGATGYRTADGNL
jgi:hypothetical protein